jgi:hypothetical protein
MCAIQKWTSDPSTPPSDCSPGFNYDQSVSVAVLSQTHIGWTNLFRGFISFDWAWVYPQSDTTPPSARRNVAIPTLARTIRALQDYCFALWTGRNAILHENSAQSLSTVNSTTTSPRCIRFERHFLITLEATSTFHSRTDLNSHPVSAPGGSV